MMLAWNRLCVVIISLLLITSCGFHLRGASQFSENLNPLYLLQSGLKESEFVLIKKRLEETGAALVEESTLANRLSVTISKLETHQIADSGTTGFELKQVKMAISFSVKSPAGSYLIKPKEIKRNREIELDSDNLLSHPGIIEKAAYDLQQDLIEVMLFQLSRY